MISYLKDEGKRLVPTAKPEKYCWVDVREPTREDLALLETEYGVNPEHLQDILDTDEQARVEKEDEYTLIIVRLPVCDSRFDLPYFTVPCGILLFPDRIVTLCLSDCEVLEEMRNGRVRSLAVRNKSAFVLHLLGRAAIVFLRYLKDINRTTAVIEKELQVSIKNHELTQLLSIEKSLVFFTTSLKSNEILLEKLQSTRSMRFKEDETDLLEDVVTDNRQAIEMANIYSDILAGMMDAFASVISNNLNIVMKRLTTISVVFMPLNVLASMGGMSEFSSFTAGIPWPMAYTFFGLGLVFVGFLTAGILKVTSLERKHALAARRRRKSPAKLAAPVAAGFVARH